MPHNGPGHITRTTLDNTACSNRFSCVRFPKGKRARMSLWLGHAATEHPDSQNARASLPGPFAQDWRNALVRGELAGAMGRAVELFGLGTEVRGTRSLDRLELPPAICALEAGGQQ